MAGSKGKVTGETKVRHHIINIIYHHPGETVKIPSTYELSKELGVARSLVLNVVKKLRDEGYLTGRRGVGIFTNPRSLSERERKLLVGILVGKGDQFYYTERAWHQVSIAGTALTGLGFNVRLLASGIGAENSLSLNFKYRYVDAVLCIGSQEETINEIRKYLPVVAVDRMWSSPLGVGFSYSSAASEWKQRLDAEGRNRFLCLLNSTHDWELFRFREIFGDIFEHDSIHFLSPHESNYPEKLEKLLSTESFDAVLGYQSDLKLAVKIFSKHNIDYRKSCYLFSLREASSEYSDQFFYMESPFDQAIPIAAQMLHDNLNGTSSQESRKYMDVKLHIPSAYK